MNCLVARSRTTATVALLAPGLVEGPVHGLDEAQRPFDVGERLGDRTRTIFLYPGPGSYDGATCTADAQCDDGLRWDAHGLDELFLFDGRVRGTCNGGFLCFGVVRGSLLPRPYDGTSVSHSW